MVLHILNGAFLALSIVLLLGGAFVIMSGRPAVARRLAWVAIGLGAACLVVSGSAFLGVRPDVRFWISVGALVLALGTLAAWAVALSRGQRVDRGRSP
jgi:hypothetical protein